MMLYDKLKNKDNLSQELIEKVKVIQGMENIWNVQNNVAKEATAQFVDKIQKMFKNLPEGTIVDIDLNDLKSHKTLDINFRNDELFRTQKAAAIRMELKPDSVTKKLELNFIDRDIIPNDNVSKEQIIENFKQQFKSLRTLHMTNKLVPEMDAVFDRRMRSMETHAEIEQMKRDFNEQYERENSFINQVKSFFKGEDDAPAPEVKSEQQEKPDMMIKLEQEMEVKAEELSRQIDKQRNVSSLDYQRAQSQHNIEKRKQKFKG